MANKALFGSRRDAALADTRNRAGGPAYRLSDRQALAQLAATGCLNQTFYADARTQLDELLIAASLVDPDFLAKTAIYTRRNGHMKDTPAVLLAALSAVSPQHLSQAFPRVIDNGRMLRNFVQILRSGATGRKSLGTRPKKLVQAWLNRASDDALLRASVGNSPALADIIRMVHPKPVTAEREAFFAWLLGRPCDVKALPRAVRDYLDFREDPAGSPVPKVPFQMLTSLKLTRKQWAKVAERGGWQMVRMNLNTFLRHGVFDMPLTRRRIAARLADAKEIAGARVFPYQLMAAWKYMAAEMPDEIREAVADAMEIAVDNVPEFGGRVVVCPDVSGSMTMPVTGARKGATTSITCMDVAALVTAAVLRKNPGARVMPFDTQVRKVSIEPGDRIVDNAHALAWFYGGGTACSAPLVELNDEKAPADLVILISDNQSWADGQRNGRTPVMDQWVKLKRRCPEAKLVCLDIAPYGTTPAHERADVLNIGGFSDSVFEVIAAFAGNRLGPDHWVGEIEKVNL